MKQSQGILGRLLNIFNRASLQRSHASSAFSHAKKQTESYLGRIIGAVTFRRRSVSMGGMSPPAGEGSQGQLALILTPALFLPPSSPSPPSLSLPPHLLPFPLSLNFPLPPHLPCSSLPSPSLLSPSHSLSPKTFSLSLSFFLLSFSHSALHTLCFRAPALFVTLCPLSPSSTSPDGKRRQSNTGDLWDLIAHYEGQEDRWAGEESRSCEGSTRGN